MILFAYTFVHMGTTSRTMHQTRTHSQIIYHHSYQHGDTELTVLPATNLQRLKDLTLIASCNTAQKYDHASICIHHVQVECICEPMHAA